jgi:uncharacterized protein YukE
MSDALTGIEEPVRFNWDAAASLERELRSTAATLDGQIPQRNAYAGDAQREWRGVYSLQFVNRMEICTTDARRLKGSLELAANQVRELAEAARREQDRRDRAMAWKREQEDETDLEEAWEYITDTDEEVPIPEPEPPPRFTTIDAGARDRA